MTMGIPLPAQKFSLGGLYHILSGAVKRKYFFVDKPAFPVVPAAHQHFRPMAKKETLLQLSQNRESEPHSYQEKIRILLVWHEWQSGTDQLAA